MAEEVSIDVLKSTATAINQAVSEGILQFLATESATIDFRFTVPSKVVNTLFERYDVEPVEGRRGMDIIKKMIPHLLSDSLDLYARRMTPGDSERVTYHLERIQAVGQVLTTSVFRDSWLVRQTTKSSFLSAVRWDVLIKRASMDRDLNGPQLAFSTLNIEAGSGHGSGVSSLFGITDTEDMTIELSLTDLEYLISVLQEARDVLKATITGSDSIDAD